MTNVVLCFDRLDERPELRDATNAEALFRMVDTARQLTWHRTMTSTAANGRSGMHRRAVTIHTARAAIVEAYEFLVDCWRPGDAIYMFGVGRGAYCARELTRLLGTVGVLADRQDDLRDYVLATCALPRTQRSPQDWQRLNRLAAQLTGQREISVPVTYLGLWDALSVPSSPRSITDPLTNVRTGRHARAIDGGPFGTPVPTDGGTVEEVWFRGAHCDVAGGPGACWPLSDIALDWILDGALAAGVLIRQSVGDHAPAPDAFDALAGHAHLLAIRELPLDATVHASVQVYLRAHPQYWHRLPARIGWADPDWPARGERLASTAAMARTRPVSNPAASRRVIAFRGNRFDADSASCPVAPQRQPQQTHG